MGRVRNRVTRPAGIGVDCWTDGTRKEWEERAAALAMVGVGYLVVGCVKKKVGSVMVKTWVPMHPKAETLEAAVRLAVEFRDKVQKS